MPRANPLRMSEKDLHYAVVDLLRLGWPSHLPWTHFPAGENRGDKITRTDKQGRTRTFSPSGAKLQRMGAQKGWPDFVFLLPNAEAAFMELKAADGSLSDEQAAFCVKAQRLGHCYEICRTIEQVEAVLAVWAHRAGARFNAHLTAGGTVRITRPDAPLFAGAGG